MVPAWLGPARDRAGDRYGDGACNTNGGNCRTRLKSAPSSKRASSCSASPACSPPAGSPHQGLGPGVGRPGGVEQHPEREHPSSGALAAQQPEKRSKAEFHWLMLHNVPVPVQSVAAHPSTRSRVARTDREVGWPAGAMSPAAKAPANAAPRKLRSRGMTPASADFGGRCALASVPR